MNKPIVGITGDIDNDKYSVKIFYANAVERAGACPIFLPPFSSKNLIETIAKTINALLISGGGDIPPHFYPVRKKAPPFGRGKKILSNRVYGERQTTDLKLISDKRFYFEKKLLKGIIALKKPILGICYGMQFLNVFQGGTLYQDLATRRPKTIDHKSSHKIKIYNKSKLYYILNKENIRVNSTHHQGINKVGKGLIVSAYSQDDVVEAIEHKNYPFFIGIQWHPERLSGKHPQKLFRSFIKAIELQRVFRYK